MAKDEVTDYSVTDASNTDIHGYPTDGDQPVNTIKYWVPALMGAIARMLAGTVAIVDTLKFKATGDATKTFVFSGANIPVFTNRSLDIEALYRSGAPLVTIYAVGTSTHTFATKTRFFRITAGGAGGGGGGVDGQGVAKLAAASGGSSGYSGFTPIYDKGALTTATVVVGAGGNGASAGANDGSNGNNTTWTDTSRTLIFGGGQGGKGVTADGGSYAVAAAPARAAKSGTTIYGASDANTSGYITTASTATSAAGKAIGGQGGSSLFGSGGVPGDSSAGGAGEGFGSGGGGAGVTDVTTNYAGGAGAAGFLMVEEW